MKPAVWEILASVPFQPLLLNVFRRASSYCYREVDVPSPYVYCVLDMQHWLSLRLSADLMSYVSSCVGTLTVADPRLSFAHRF